MDTSEHAFETYIVEHLSDVHGYRLRESKAQYDKSTCLDWELLLEFIIGTQEQTWRELEKQHGRLVTDKFARRLVKEIERRGTMDVLRRGVKDSGCYFQLAYFAPSTTLNPEHQALYGKNILSVIRQFKYSKVETHDALDLGIFLNGLPIFTLELKNKQTGQSV